MFPATAASASQGGYFPPHALKPKLAALNSGLTLFDFRKTGPVSRSHESFVGISMRSTWQHPEA